MTYIFSKSPPEDLLLSVAKERGFVADRFPVTASDILRPLIPMKELFMVYVCGITREFRFFHGRTADRRTVEFYGRYPSEVYSADYMARHANTVPGGYIFFDREAFNERVPSDRMVQDRFVTETGNGPMALCLLTVPADFSREIRRVSPFLKTGCIALVMYRDAYDDPYRGRDKELFYKYIGALHQGLLDSVKARPGQMICPVKDGGRAIFSFGPGMDRIPEIVH